MRRMLWFTMWFTILSCLLGALAAAPQTASAGGTKTLSGKVKSLKDNVLEIRKSGLVSVSIVEVEMNSATKVTGQLVPGMHVKVKYREEGGHKFALEIETRPEYASKEAKQAAKQTQP
jgi:hypothetical protein